MIDYPIADMLFALMLQGWLVWMFCNNEPVTAWIEPRPTQADRAAHDVEATVDGRNILIHVQEMEVRNENPRQ